MTTSTSQSRRFLRELPQLREALSAQLLGLADAARLPYADLLLNRLIVLMLVQSHGLLDGDLHYLQRQLAAARAQTDAAGTFQGLLRQLGLYLSASTHDAVNSQRFGALPALGSSLFASHALEQRYPQLDLPDTAWQQLLGFCAGFAWSLDEAQHERALTPALLGALSEQSADHKQLGVYYTAPDVSSYIATATLIPCLLEAWAERCPALLGGQGRAWQLLRQSSARYLFAAMAQGLDQPLPPIIAAGIAAPGQREAWNDPATAPWALPGESWREHVARRQHCLAVQASLGTGRVAAVDDLVSLNLDLQGFAQDVVGIAAPAELATLAALLPKLSVLDPTCGAGAFLAAALAVLAPLFLACCERLLCDATPEHSALRAQAARFTSMPAFARSMVVRHNLYGVDIVPLAAELCRLRLLLACVTGGAPAQRDCYPELERHIRCGDALEAALPVPWSTATSGVQETEPGQVSNKASAQGAEPGLHWAAAFPEVRAEGGFWAIIGNPPYVLRGQAQRGAYGGYRTASCGNLYALVMERSLHLLHSNGRLGMILPVASVATDGMRPLQALYQGRRQWHSHFAVRPARLFEAVDMNLTITLLGSQQPDSVFSSGYRRWSSGERASLLPTLTYCRLPQLAGHCSPLPKLGNPLEVAILEQMRTHGQKLGAYGVPTGTTIYYHSGGRYWRKALLHKPSSHYKPLTLPPALAALVLALLNSQLFYWYWISHSNCMDVVGREVQGLPVFALSAEVALPFQALSATLLEAYQANSSLRQRQGRQINGIELNITVRQAKPIIDQIDRLLASHYGFDAEQLDYILNYDIKYRCPLYSKAQSV